VRNETLRIMKNEVLAIRAKADNATHNLWLNNGTWSVAYTIHLPDNTKRRVRQSLGTKEVTVARLRRDALFAQYSKRSNNAVTGASTQSPIT
jgi:hypothetical protein